MGNLLNGIGEVIKGFGKATELQELYDNSEPLKHAVKITLLLNCISQTADKQTLEHLKVDLKIHVDAYKIEFEKLGINISDYLHFEVK
ncbi:MULTISPECIES: hypothetical protein [unclassified Treponema]|uniref:hypothetical protein n=1 Tax=unclassified Treponema TaxID=2638727 RepID=UPI0020A5F165|nr:MULTISPECIES: hypothetical protein [unclassified Treponema]UTC67293.1 hypothetical protein E4O06_01065 [Treponema sp. OMZ 789]UTC70021.1 hypothetical protein E4O01_01060 [Treponema sp. OMZ 790]UTC72737.1 hypothetical protein E4O02_01060 [Treponema sp. OMZ 791]